MLTDDFRCISEEKDLFEMVRLEEIDELNACFENIKRLKMVAADGATNYMRECVDAMDDATFDIWMKYHFSICERMDLIGATNHALDILKKISKKSLVSEKTRRIHMLELRKMNLKDIKEQWEYGDALPTDENGLTNPYEGITFEEYETTVLP